MTMPRYDNDAYDPRVPSSKRRGPPENGARQRRDRSRSRSPDGDLEASRRARMARLRAENDDEERQLASLDEPVKPEVSAKDQIVQVDQKELEGLDEEEQMTMLVGFSGGFGSTKGQKVEDNHQTSAKGAAAKNKARKYRQYMNRKNGFNRPLDKMD